MQIKESITINLDENEVKNIVASYLKSRGYKCESKDVRFDIGKAHNGLYEEMRFKECNVRVTK